MADWTEEKERSNPFALKLICWIALHLSRRFARLWLWPITFYFYVSSPKVRFSSRKYLERVNKQECKFFDVIHHIHHFSAIVLDRVYFLTDQFERFDIQVHGDECLDELAEQGQGAILLGAHLGSFDALRCLAISRQKLPLKILMYHDHNAMITKIIDELNPEIAQSVINLADPSALLEMKEALEAGCLVGMLGDRVLENEKSIECTLLDDSVSFPAGPLSIALMLGVPVINFFGIYRGKNQYEVFFSSLYSGQQVSRKERSDRVLALTQQYAHEIELMIEKYPYNWFNFYDYWGDGQ